MKALTETNVVGLTKYLTTNSTKNNKDIDVQKKEENRDDSILRCQHNELKEKLWNKANTIAEHPVNSKKQNPLPISYPIIQIQKKDPSNENKPNWDRGRIDTGEKALQNLKAKERKERLKSYSGNIKQPEPKIRKEKEAITIRTKLFEFRNKQQENPDNLKSDNIKSSKIKEIAQKLSEKLSYDSSSLKINTIHKSNVISSIADKINFFEKPQDSKPKRSFSPLPCNHVISDIANRKKIFENKQGSPSKESFSPLPSNKNNSLEIEESAYVAQENCFSHSSKKSPTSVGKQSPPSSNKPFKEDPYADISHNLIVTNFSTEKATDKISQYHQDSSTEITSDENRPIVNKSQDKGNSLSEIDEKLFEDSPTTKKSDVRENSKNNTSKSLEDYNNIRQEKALQVEEIRKIIDQNLLVGRNIDNTVIKEYIKSINENLHRIGESNVKETSNDSKNIKAFYEMMIRFFWLMYLMLMMMSRAHH